jgi:Flp pilus assembly protein TadG
MRCGITTRPTEVRRGIATVELALVLPFLLLTFVMIGDFSRIFHYSVIVTSCARNGALYASDQTIADVSPYASLEEAALADAAGLSPQPVIESTTGVHASGLEFVEVTATYPFRMLTQLPGIPESVNIVRKVRMIKKPSDIVTGP